MKMAMKLLRMKMTMTMMIGRVLDCSRFPPGATADVLSSRSALPNGHSDQLVSRWELSSSQVHVLLLQNASPSSPEPLLGSGPEGDDVL